MNNSRASSSRGGVEDPLAPRPGSSKPTAGRHKTAPTLKRKAPDEEENQAGNGKRIKSLQSKPAAVVKGEKKAGGLIITPLPSTSNVAPGPSSTLAIAPPPRPPSSHGTRKGKAKAREDVAPTRQDIEVEEEVRRMDAERERLHVREAQAQSHVSLDSEFNNPLLPPSSIPRRRQTALAKGNTSIGATIDTSQPLPLRDTPTIDRNRAMRGEAVERRRSSLSKRGKRASSSFEHTGIIPQPHASVSTANFHKHIDRELPEAHRARHLLVWCASRTSARPSTRSASQPANPPLPPLTTEGTTILQDVQKEIQKMLTEQRIDTSFSSRREEDGDRPKVKPHEQNLRNLKREDDFLRHIDRCKREDDAWSSVIQSYNARQASTVDALSRQRHHDETSLDWIPPDTSDPLYEREFQGAQLARRCKEIASRKRGGSPFTLRLGEVENKVDRLHSCLHISQQLMNRTTRHLDKRFEALATALAARSQPRSQPSDVSTLANLVSANPNPPSGTGLGVPPDTLSILRALTRTDMEHPRREIGDAARKAAREVQRVNATPAKQSAGGAATSSRRLTAVTPRAAPGTPRRAGTPRQKSEGVENGG
ncbi:Mis12-Mtw1 protein family-domain-containing protein [Gautieria morchelliformis]|nr:Mis12-Mtw1 protein family-domain-containing protein [Gautieria morchelliformis]